MTSRFPPMHLPCGATSEFDLGSGCSYRCTRCHATIGSIGMPRDCKTAMDKYKTLKALGSTVHWDYEKGQEVDISC